MSGIYLYKRLPEYYDILVQRLQEFAPGLTAVGCQRNPLVVMHSLREERYSDVLSKGGTNG